MKTIINTMIYDYHTFYKNGYITFDDEIIEVGDMITYNNKNKEVIDGTGMIVLPGMINGHSHIYSTFSKGLNVPFEPKDFKELLEQLWWKVDRNLMIDQIYHSGIISGITYLKNGVTTIFDHHASKTISGTLNTLHQALNTVCKMRTSLCFETSDRFDIEKAIKENKTFLDKHQTNSSRAMFGMHAAFTLKDETLKMIQKKLGNYPIHIHVAEGNYDQNHSIKHYNKTVIERLNDFNLITPNSILVHGIQLSDEELKIIKDNHATVAINVSSNMNNGVGLPDVLSFLKHQINVIIGNDGLGYSIAKEYQNILYAMHHLYQNPVDFQLDSLKKLIQNTYEFTSSHFNIKLGKLNKGYKADLLMIPYKPITPINKDNIMSHLVFGLFNDFKPKEVYINGYNVIHNQTFYKEESGYIKDASKSAAAFFDAIKREVK